MNNKLKICIFDGNYFKFLKPLISHWKELGHEVMTDKSFDPKLVQWCDLAWFEFCENSMIRASHENDELWNVVEGQIKDKIIICRVHDLDYWTGNCNVVTWDWVTHVVYIADHIRKRAILDRPQLEPKHSLIKHGIDLDKYILRKDRTVGKIAWIGNVNWMKQPEFALQLMADLPRNMELHMVGRGWRTWDVAWREQFIGYNHLNVFFYDSVPEINDFLEDKQFLLSTSVKEGFGFAIGEAMVKGIKPLIRSFYGSYDVWPEKLIWNDVEGLKRLILEPYTEEDMRSYRSFIEMNYNQERMFKEYDELFEKLWKK